MGRQSFTMSLLFIGQFFFFFLTPLPIVGLEVCWKGPSFILICACALLQGRPLGACFTPRTWLEPFAEAWPVCLFTRQPCSLAPSWPAPRCYLDLLPLAPGPPPGRRLGRLVGRMGSLAGDVQSLWHCQQTVLSGRGTLGAWLCSVCSVVQQSCLRHRPLLIPSRQLPVDTQGVWC